MANKDFTAALVITVIFVITLNILHTSNVLDNVRDVLSREKFQINGAPVANCGTYNNANHSETGSVYYPLHDNDSVKHLRDGNHLGAELNAELNLD